MASALRSLISGAKKLAIGTDGAAPMRDLFTKTDPAVDGDACSHDCESCHVKYPRGFKIEESDLMYGEVKAWSTHLLVATGKTDWAYDVEDEKGSVMQAMGKAAAPTNGKLKLSASNIPTPHGTTSYDHPTSVLLLPSFTILDDVHPKSVSALIDFVSQAPTNTSPLELFTPPKALPSSSPHHEQNGNHNGDDDTTKDDPATLPSLPPEITVRPCPHKVLILLCSQKTRDARCGQSAPLIRKELQRHLQPLGLYRDLDDERPGGVGIYFISHVGGHKYSANVMVYRRPDPFGLDNVARAQEEGGDDLRPRVQGLAEKGGEDVGDVGAGQCIWLGRVMPEDCENLVKYTVLQGKVVKPERQLRGGFNRERGLMSW